MLVALLLTALAAPTPDCHYDRAAMSALLQGAFDQDMTGGWRALANRGCDLEAADLIRDWREARAPTPRQIGILFWHEGQLRANAGQAAAAIALFERSRKSAEQDAGMGWNFYVDGSIAFLRRDRAAFDRARTTLAALPRPADFDPRDPDGHQIAIAWPINLNVLDGFARCWDQPYKLAYACGTPMRQVTVPSK